MRSGPAFERPLPGSTADDFDDGGVMLLNPASEYEPTEARRHTGLNQAESAWPLEIQPLAQPTEDDKTEEDQTRRHSSIVKQEDHRRTRSVKEDREEENLSVSD
uniref:ATP-binding protein n=1 Tax=Panagrellus redivivus TaxID=6233 RepID=A0A7E4V787_PANRE